jgi:hypothetical protein
MIRISAHLAVFLYAHAANEATCDLWYYKSIEAWINNLIYAYSKYGMNIGYTHSRHVVTVISSARGMYLTWIATTNKIYWHLKIFTSLFAIARSCAFDCHYFRRTASPSSCDGLSEYLYYNNTIRRSKVFRVTQPWCCPTKMLGNKHTCKVLFRHTPVALYFSGKARCVRSPAADMVRYHGPL